MTCISRDTEQAAAEARNFYQLQNVLMESKTHSVSVASGKIGSFHRVKMAGT